MTAPHLIEIESGRIGYRDVIDHVLKNGEPRESRDGPTLDAGWTTIVLPPWDTLPVGVGRKIAPRIAAAEAVQLIGGFSDPDLLPASFDRYREDNGEFHGAYGRRLAVGDQLARQVAKLRRDPETRQAVVTIWNPIMDNEPKRDIPCTVTIGFRRIPLPLGGDRLDTHVTMRSNDVFTGVPYDWFQFGQLQLTVARSLNVMPGRYVHTAWSLHLYERDRERAVTVGAGAPVALDYEPHRPGGLCRTPGDDWSVVTERARKIPYESELLQNMTPDEMWYRRVLTS